MPNTFVFSAMGAPGAPWSRRALVTVIAPIVVGCIVATVAIFTLSAFRPTLIAAAFCGLAVFLPTLVLKEPKLYWLVLFIFSIQFDISKRLTTWMAEPWILFEKYGTPASGNLSIHFYLSDVILFMLMIPWVLKLVRRQERLYFPPLLYLPLAYLGWALFSSLLHAVSLHLSFFEWIRQLLYFVSLVYIANNITSVRYVRGLLFALTAALLLQATIVHVVFHRQTTSYLLGGVYRERSEGLTLDVGPLYASEKDAGSD